MQESTLRYRSARTWLFYLYFSGAMFRSQQPFENTAAVESATSPAKFANALNYSRSLALILDKFLQSNCKALNLRVETVKNEWVHEINWDCVAFDEYHYGAWRESAKELFAAEGEKEIKKAKILDYSTLF
jgi:hypothetical protein